MDSSLHPPAKSTAGTDSAQFSASKPSASSDAFACLTRIPHGQQMRLLILFRKVAWGYIHGTGSCPVGTYNLEDFWRILENSADPSILSCLTFVTMPSILRVGVGRQAAADAFHWAWPCLLWSCHSWGSPRGLLEFRHLESLEGYSLAHTFLS